MDSYRVLIDTVMPGCLSNFLNCSKIFHYMKKNGHKITNDPSKADFIFVVTCGTTNNSEKDSVDCYKRYHFLKKQSAKVIIFGCLVKVNEECLKNLDSIDIGLYEGHLLDDIFYNNVKFSEMKSICDEDTLKKLLHGKIILDSYNLYSTLVPLVRYKLSNKKNVDENRGITDIGLGCTGNCSYCVIRKAKGKAHSIDSEVIFDNIKTLKESCKTIILSSEDCGFYGIGTKKNLPKLLYEIKEKFPDLTIYVDYIDPFWLQKYPEEYIKLFKNMDIKMIITPIQSGSNTILKAMRRRYKADPVIKIIKEIKKVSPNTLLYNQIIVGFPGETWSDFFKSFFVMFNYDFNLIYPYNERKGADSALLPNKKSQLTINMRYSLIMIFAILSNLVKLTKNYDLFLTHRNRFYFKYK